VFLRTKEKFVGQDCIKLENDALAVWATKSVGPRILGLALSGGENLFAELPDQTLDCPGNGVFHFYGGHRLWHAPEDPQRTYLPDDSPVDVSEIEAGVCLSQPTEVSSGIQKEISIRLPGTDAQVIVEHRLRNLGKWPVELAVWAITQLNTGGEAILPIGAPTVDQYGARPNQHLALWPYTDLNSPHLRLGKQLIRLRADMTKGAFKLGFGNQSGWLAYLLGDTLFVKFAPYRPESGYYDYGSSSECYCSVRFIELESLSPRVTLAPGEVVSHREEWALFKGVFFPEDEASLIDVLKGLRMEISAGEL
jgi:hypothetical protein